MSKKDYRVRNWPEYNKALITRGSITFWINEKTTKKWYESSKNQAESRGRPKVYSDLAIETCLILRMLFNLPLRRCQGFVESLLTLLKLPLTTPSYTQICRRQKTLKMKLKHHVKGGIHVVVDGTGLKVFGEGEWKVRQHGYSKHRMWMKLHVGIDVKSQQIVMMKLTDNHIGENKLLEPLLAQYKGGYTTIGGDKGYDSFDCHELVGAHKAQSAILIQRNSKIRQHLSCEEEPWVRDNILRRIRALGRKGWKKEVGYHQRSLVETTFFRFKTTFGSKLRSLCFDNQQREALIGCNLLNWFTQLGLPDSIAIN